MGFSLAAASGVHLLVAVCGLLLLQGMGSRHTGLSSYDPQAQ